MRTQRILVATTAAVGLVLLTALPAAAHVTIPNPAPRGGFGIVTFSVPNERDNASTVKLEVKMPADANVGLRLTTAQARLDGRHHDAPPPRAREDR